MKFQGLVTTIGSLPHINSQDAVNLILRYTPKIPAWPQLPKKCFKENMYTQYSENFPGIITDNKTQKIHLDPEKVWSELEKFYEHYLANDIDYFAISEEYASGFYSLLNHFNHLSTIKCQTTGPVTFGLAIKNELNQSIFYDTQLRDVIIKHIIMKSLWQIKEMKLKAHPPDGEEFRVILFLDEPYLAAYGSAFTAISRDDIINSLQEVIKGIKAQYHLLIGVHCCANTDWSILLDTDIDILSFDAYEFFPNLTLYIDKLNEFINRGGILAWGIVPTTEEILKKESPQTLNDKLTKYLETLIEKGIKKDKLISQMVITPACGLGTQTEQTSELALQTLSEISQKWT